MIRLSTILLGCVLLLAACTDRDPNYDIDLDAVKTLNSGRDGCPEVEYPNWKASPYVLPYPVGKTYKVDLANCSLYNHAPGEIDQFAVDFLMPIGSEIVASRDGVVVEVIDHNEDYTHSTNRVIIQHADYTYAHYTSLTKEGSLVQEGELVERGQVIAYSGATGFSAYPHIHFIVTEGGYESPYTGLPITFSNTEPNPVGLNSFTFYTSYVY